MSEQERELIRAALEKRYGPAVPVTGQMADAVAAALGEADELELLVHDEEAGACAAMLPGCLQPGYWKPFYRAHACRKCIESDQRCAEAGHLPPWWPNARGDHAGH